MARCSRTPEGIDFLARHLTREQIDRLIKYDWSVNARDDQLAPVLAKGGGRWHTWLLLGGRGSGKTRAGAEWIRAQVVGEPPLADRRSHRIALVGDTIAQVRSVMIEGVSGLFAVYPRTERPKLEASKNQLVWDILDGSAVKRTLFAASPSATYTAAQQTADFGSPQSSVSLRIFQISATRGRGTPRDAVV